MDAIALSAGPGLLPIALLAPLTLHLAARFPERSAVTGRQIAAFYLLVAGLVLAGWLLPARQQPYALVLLLLCIYAGFGLAAYQLLHVIRRTQPTNARIAQQARLLLLSLTLAALPLLLLPFSPLVSVYLAPEAIIGAQVLIPIGLAVAVLRQDLIGLDRALRRTLSSVLVSFALLVIYFGLATALTQLSRDLGGRWSLVATVASVLAAAAAFTPLQRAAQRAIDQAFYPDRLRFGQTIAAARARLATVVQRGAVVTLLEQELPPQLGASGAALTLGRLTAVPQPELAGGWGASLLVGGQTIGHYTLGPRRSGLRYAPEEQEQLLALVQQAALALAYAETVDTLVQLNDELEERVAVRTDHVLAQQRELVALEERQRLARELHDSVKQTLFSLGIGLRAARSRVSSDPQAAISLLAQHEQTVVQAQREMGDLLTQLRTDAGGTADLVALLTEHAAQLRQHHGLQTALNLPPALLLPEPLARELAQIVKEALHNAARHSGAAAAAVQLTLEPGGFVLAVRDAGRGFAAAQPQAGFGLRSMRERAELIGGTLTIRSAPGAGTEVTVRVGLPS